ncbi:MAG: protein-L-isoaspartate(D-aspartate) O-methyltransferase [Magnetococcus sp. YQC-5]
MLDPASTRASRQAMVKQQLESRGIRDLRVLQAMAEMPRERFVSPDLSYLAYWDGPLAIAHGQTISQPYMVAAMAEALALTGTEVVLEIGAGSGYGAALLSRLARTVIAVERIAPLLEEAQHRWTSLGLRNIIGVLGDGSCGVAEYAPFDGISVTAAAPVIPPSLVAQLRPEVGRMTIPVGERHWQYLCLVRRSMTGAITMTREFPCTFVPLLGKEGWSE